LQSTETHQVEIDQNDKEAKPENDIPSIQAKNVEKLYIENPLLEIDPADTENINIEETEI
jgi:hypothetical protein